MKCAAFILLMALLCPGALAQECTIPPVYENQVSLVTGDTLWVGFATDKTCYDPGDTVRFYLVVKNIGTQVFYINWGTDPQDGVFVLPEGCTDLYQAGCFDLDEPIYYWPWWIYYFSVGTTLQPGECRVWQSAYWPIATWGDGPPEAGVYNVLGGMYKPPGIASGEFGEFVVPPGGILLQLAIDCTIGVEETTWGLIKYLYRQ